MLLTRPMSLHQERSPLEVDRPDRDCDEEVEIGRPRLEDCGVAMRTDDFAGEDAGVGCEGE